MRYARIIGLYAALLVAAGAAAEAPWDATPQVRYTFAGLDENRDGRLAKVETRFAEELHRGFAVADADGDGLLSRAEYDEAMAIEAELFGAGEHSGRKRRMFVSLDADRDGAISPAEAGARPALARSFRYADTDGDGRIDRGEFAEISLETLAPPPGPGATWRQGSR